MFTCIRLWKRQQCCKPKIGGETQVTNKLSTESSKDQIQYKTMCERSIMWYYSHEPLLIWILMGKKDLKGLGLLEKQNWNGKEWTHTTGQGHAAPQSQHSVIIQRNYYSWLGFVKVPFRIMCTRSMKVP